MNSQQGKKQFIFDRVFEEDTGQQDIWDYVSDSVNSFIQGYNVSILAYGQSGSGKSYTMGTSGPQEQDDPTHMGIVPRAAQTLFEKLNAVSGGRTMSGLRTPKRYSTNPLAQAGQTDKNWTLKATYVEIYNEQLRDLLVDESVHPADRATVAFAKTPRVESCSPGSLSATSTLRRIYSKHSTSAPRFARLMRQPSMRAHPVLTPSSA